MSWRDLLQTGDEKLTSPWVGGRVLRAEERTWTIDGRLPPEHGWSTFRISGRKATWEKLADAQAETLKYKLRGYLIGDRLVPDDAIVDPDPAKIADQSEPVALLDGDVERFARIGAGRTFDGGPLIYIGPEMPLGPEEEVQRAFFKKAASVDNIRGVTPALDAAFRMETFQRAEAERRRLELERLRKEEEERLQREDARKKMEKTLDHPLGRRAMALIDFAAAARAALQVGNAEYLDHRKAHHRNEMIVDFRVDRRQFQCTCDAATLGIIDSGICLTDHVTGRKDDTRLTLESLPSVIREAQRTNKLVVYRHVGEEEEFEDD